MTNSLATSIDEAPFLASRLSMSYTLTTGHAAGTFIAELARHRILGSRCDACARVVTPSQDYCVLCGGVSSALVHVPETGTVTSLTRTSTLTLGLVRLDGVDADLLHRLDGRDGPITVGTRVKATWADVPVGSILDLEAFVATEDAAHAEVGEVSSPPDDLLSIPEQAYALELDYRHAYGPHYGRLFDELGSSRRLIGSRCPSCTSVLVPPREFCDVCFVRTAGHVEVADTGRLQAFSIIHLEFVGQTRKPPYVYAEIVLDGSATRVIHTMAGIDVSTAADHLHVGMPVRAVWKDKVDCTGTLTDIDYFEPAEAGPERA